MSGARAGHTRSGRSRAAGTSLRVALVAALALTAGLLAPGTATATGGPSDDTASQQATGGVTKFERQKSDRQKSDRQKADRQTSGTNRDSTTKDTTTKDAPTKVGKRNGGQDRVQRAEEPEFPPAPVPSSSADLPTAVDPLPPYEGQADCRPPEVTARNEGTVALAQLIRDTYGSFATAVGGIHRVCSMGGSDATYGSQSEHKEGRAVDWMIDQAVPAEEQVAEAFIDWLLATDENGNEFAMARRLGVMYIGWGDHIWESYRRGDSNRREGWSQLKGCFSKQDSVYDTYCHRDHIHISLSWDGAAGRTSFWGGSPTPVPFCNRWQTAASDAKPAGRGLDYVPVAPRRVLDTRSGLGLPSGSACRLWQRPGGISLNGTMNPRHSIGAPVVVRVADLRGAPSADIRAVAVRTMTIGSNSPATLRAVTFAGQPIAPVVIGGRTEATTVIPVGTDGTIAFTTDSGATHLVVDILGYFVSPPAVTAIGTGLTLSNGAVVYDSADDTVLGPRERRTIRVNVDGAAPTGALLALTISGAERSGNLVVRPGGTKRTAATPVLPFRRADSSTQTIMTKLGDDGEIIVVNRSRGPVSLQVAVQASTLPMSTSGSLVVPVTPTSIDGRRTSLRRVMRDAQGAVGVVLQVDAATTSKPASIIYWSGTAASTTLNIGRKSRQSSLIVVPMIDSPLIMREIVGGDVDITARIVAYLR